MASPLNDTAVTCIGVDVGGTFTDVVLSDGTRTWRAKAPSTPGELGRGVLDACRLVAERAGTTLEARAALKGAGCLTGTGHSRRPPESARG